jgi:ribonucleoside-triphosphate reductase
MNEACVNFLKKDIFTKEGKEFTLEVLDYMRDVLQKYQEETGDKFNLEATPAESTAYRFAKMDKKLYPDIIVANEDEVKEFGADPFYSNSTQLAVNATNDLFEALDHQDEIQCRYTGGTVFHVFLGERMPSIKSTRNLVRKIAENYKLPYFSITPTLSVCPKHGYLPGEHEFCPLCDEEIGYK